MSVWTRYYLIFILLTHISLDGFADSLSWAGTLESIRNKFSDVRHLPITDLADWLNDKNRNPPLIFDTREKEEHAVSHLPKAKHLDPGSDINSIFRNLKTTSSIVVYCSVGYRSSIVARKLQKLGFTNVHNLDGSIFAWANSGFPLVKDGKPARCVHPFDSRWGILLNKEFHCE
jgi:rhodanese-related sulfurtransferase